MARPRKGSAPSKDERKPRSKPGFKGVKSKSKKSFKKGADKKLKKFPKTGPKPAVSTKTTGTKRPAVDEDNNEQKKIKLCTLDVRKRREIRRGVKSGADRVKGCKDLWERTRQRNLGDKDKTTLLNSLVEKLTGHVYQLSLKHDTARVVQSCLKTGSREQRSVIFSELKEHVVELSKLKYGKFTIKALFKYCTSEERGQLISSLYGNVRKLIRHSEAAEIVEIAYNDWANASQRDCLLAEFYGPLASLYKDIPLSDLVAAGSEHRASILKDFKDSLLPLCDKTVIRHSIVHKALLDYFLICESSAKVEMIEHLREVLVNIVHTKEGSKVTLNCLWHGTPKDRKIIIKSFKTHVAKICLEESGHIVMLGLFDCVDDTVLVRKAMLSELVSSLEALCDNTHGRHVLLYLLAPRSSKHFSPQFIDLLTPGDGNEHSKKTHAARWDELLVGVANPLIELATSKAVEWCKSGSHAILLLQIIESLRGGHNLGQLYDSIVSGVGELVASPSGHRVLKRLLEDGSSSEFGELVVASLTQSQVEEWVATNRGAFVLASLVKSGVGGARKRVGVKTVKSVCKKGTLQGQKALLNELDKS